MQKQSRHVATPSTSSASSMSSAASVPRRMRPSRRGLAPIDTGAANRLSPAVDQRDGASSPSSLKLRPLSLAASLHGGDASPMKRFERPAFSPHSRPTFLAQALSTLPPSTSVRRATTKKAEAHEAPRTVKVAFCPRSAPREHWRWVEQVMPNSHPCRIRIVRLRWGP